MINLEKISLEQILSLLRILDSSSSFSIATIRRRYKGESKNFDDTVAFLKEIKVIKTKKGGIGISKELSKVSSLNSETIKQLLVDAFFENGHKVLETSANFFEGFTNYENSYLFKPTTSERLKHSGIRNFFISIGILEYSSQHKGYLAKKRLSEYLTSRNKTFSYSQFLKQHSDEVELGCNAELLVYEQERSLFQNEPAIQKKIRHVSIEDVLAGYDILSFRKLKDGRLSQRYIEVKAVSIKNWRFFWSRNEIEKAKLLRESYCLYLVPVDQKGTLNTLLSLQIENPYYKVFLNKSDWQQEVEVFSISKKQN